MTQNISSSEVRELYSSKDEFALIDPREEMLFARAHLFAATNVPLSRLELMMSDAVPHDETLIVLCDDGEGTSEKAAAHLAQMGYKNLSVLGGGVPEWALSGGAVFAGVHVPSKAFGEFAEKYLETPSITADTLAEKIEAGEKLILLDSRPSDEHFDFCIPGAISCPSAELIYRCADLALDDKTQIVVHCAGRTRSIVGAQTLIDAGIENRVVSLENGTPAWEFSGFKLETESQRMLPAPDADCLRAAQEIGQQIRGDWQIGEVEPNALADWRRQGGTRYVFDIRTEEEYLSGHLNGSIHVAGGQLLQTTERHMVVQNVAVVLIDSDAIRATTTAMWLRRMGWSHISVCTLDAAQLGLETGSPTESNNNTLQCASLHDAVKEVTEKGVLVFDVRNSVAYRTAHISGACFLTRADWARDRLRLPKGDDILLMADDLPYAQLIARDLQREGRSVRLIDTDIDTWKKAGHPVSHGMECMISRPIDVYLGAGHFESPAIRERENRAYLQWEIALIDHIADDPAVKFTVGVK